MVRPGKDSGDLPFLKGERPFLVLVFLVSLALISLGLWLRPDPSGAGTHTQLGLPPCGHLLATGKPCITCGCTTAFAFAAHGRIFRALWTQPFGAFFFFLCLAAALASLHAFWTGRSLILRIALWPWARLILATLALLVLSWVFKLLTWPKP